MSDDQSSVPMTSTAKPRALGAFGFASYMRSGFEGGDEEMVAAKFEKLGNRIETLEGVLADIMQYELSGILPSGLILRMNETEVTI